mgnify:CR=1 FL=1
MTGAFMAAAIAEAEAGLAEGGIPIGSVLVHDGRIIGRGHNRRVQRGSSVLHGEIDDLVPPAVAAALHRALSPSADPAGDGR